MTKDILMQFKQDHIGIKRAQQEIIKIFVRKLRNMRLKKYEISKERDIKCREEMRVWNRALNSAMEALGGG